MNTLIAIKTGNLKIVKEKIEKCNIQVKYYTLGISALHLAIRHNKLEIAQLLIQSGANVNIITNTNSNILYGIHDGDPASHLSLRYADHEMLNLLIKSEIDLSLRDKDHKTALMLSIELDNRESTSILLENGAAKFQNPDEITKLVVYLSHKKDYELIATLFVKEMDLDNKFQEKSVFLFLFKVAIKNTDLDLIDFLFKKIDKLTLSVVNEILNLKNQTAIDLTIDYLISKGEIDQIIAQMINTKNTDGVGSLMSSGRVLLHAIEFSNLKLIDIILDKLESDGKVNDVFAEIIKTTPEIKKNAWHKLSVLEHCIEHKLYRVLELLLKNGAELNACLNPNIYYDKKIPLFHAIKENDFELVQLLVTYDADINQCVELKEVHTSNSGGIVIDKLYYTTPLSFAIELGNTRIAKLLIKSGVDINFTKSWIWYPHSTASCHNGFLTCPVELIIKKNNVELLDFIYTECTDEVSYVSLEKISKIRHEVDSKEFQKQLPVDKEIKDEMAIILSLGEIKAFEVFDE